MISRSRIDEIRNDIEGNHWQCIEPFIGGRGGFGETFCGHIHELDMTFKDQAEHYGITLFELANVTAAHIRRLDDSMNPDEQKLNLVIDEEARVV